MPFNLPLSPNYRLTSDSENVILQHKYKLKGKVAWDPIAYFQTIGKAVDYYVRLLQRKSNIKGWDELKCLTKALQDDIRAITTALDVRFGDTAKDLRA